jgi:hypothetical protein
MKRAKKIKRQLSQRRASLKQPLPKQLSSNSCNRFESHSHFHLCVILVLITDSMPIHHSFLQVFNMLVGPLAILACGILLLVLSEDHHVRALYSRLVDPIIGCLLFLSYFIMLFAPGTRSRLVAAWTLSARLSAREVMHLVLQAKPGGLNSDQIETTLLESVGDLDVHERTDDDPLCFRSPV